MHLITSMKYLTTTLFSLCSIFNLVASEKPNVLIFLVDDMGLMDTSVPNLTDATGQPEVHPLNQFYRTPNMEILAGQGMRFETFYAHSVCSPTRVSILTGQNAARHHTTQWIHPEKQNGGKQGPADWQWEGITEQHQTLPKLFQADGYRTIFVGKAHLGPSNAYGEFPDNLGFDVNIGGCAWGQPGSYYGQDGFGWINRNKRRAVPHLEAYHGKDIYLTEALTLEMNAAIQTAVAEGTPFFAYMAYYAVHSPFQANKKYLQHYADSGKSKQAQAYATMVESMDASVGAILAELNALGVAEDTLIIFLGDNGSDAPLGDTHTVASSAPLRGKKGTHYEGGMRIPFITAWAKPEPSNAHQQKLPIRRGVLTTEMGTIVDIFPTLLELVDIEYDHVIDGDNLAPILAGGQLDAEREFLMHFPHAHRSSYYTVYRKGDWKLIYHYNEPLTQRFELFNLQADPAETTNLSDQKPEQLQRLFTKMTAALEDADAQYPVSEKAPHSELHPKLHE